MASSVMYKRIRCSGQTRANERCSTAKRLPESEVFYCHYHIYQNPEAPPYLRCGVVVAGGNRCTYVARSGTFDQPGTCHRHAQLSPDLNFIVCYGVRTSGKRCTTSVRWAPPYSPYCHEHKDQFKNSRCPITRLPYELVYNVLCKLDPIERAAFALVNRSCAAVVRSWGMRRGKSAKPIIKAKDFFIFAPIQPRNSSISGAPRSEANQVTLFQSTLFRAPNPSIPRFNATSSAEIEFMRSLHTASCQEDRFYAIDLVSHHVSTLSSTPVARLDDWQGRMKSFVNQYPWLIPAGTFSQCCYSCHEPYPSSDHPNRPIQFPWFCSSCAKMRVYVPWCERCCDPVSLLALARSLSAVSRRRSARLELIGYSFRT